MPNHLKHTINLQYKSVTGAWLLVLTWSCAVFNIRAAEHIGQCSMLKSKENKSEIWLTANFDSGGIKVDDRALESIFIL